MLESKFYIEYSPEYIDRIFSDPNETSCGISKPKVFTGDVALKGLKAHFHRALHGTLSPTIYLSSIDCGMGKTTAVCEFIREWKASGFTPDKGIVVLVSRIAEIATYIARSGLDPEDYAVLISKDKRREWQGEAEANPAYPPLGLDKANADDARILFTTQQMYENRVLPEGMGSTPLFQYKGKARALAVWDESYFPSKQIVIRQTAIQALPDDFYLAAPDFVAGVDRLLEDVRAAGQGVITIPSALGDRAKALMKAVDPKRRKRQYDTLDNLRRLSGRKVLLSRDNLGSTYLVGCSERLPSGDVPIIVMDASLRVREPYSFPSDVEAVRLQTASADYQNLSIHWWNTPCSKSILSNKDKSDPITNAVAAKINEKPDEQWLVIHHKANGDIQIERDVIRGITCQSNVSFIHWGDHHGTNKYNHIRNVIVMGFWIEPDASYQGRHAAIMGKIEEPLNDIELAHIKDGEHRHNLMQAISRSNIRNHVEGVCGEATVYIIADGRHQPDRLLKEAFPGCKICDWLPTVTPLTGRKKAVADAVIKAFEDPSVMEVRKITIRKAVGFKHKQDMTRVLDNGEVANTLRRCGIAVTDPAFIRVQDGKGLCP